MRVRFLLAATLAVAVLTFVSCHRPARKITPPAILKVIKVHVDDSCIAKLSTGAPANPLRAETGDIICWTNSTTTGETVIIKIDNIELFGRDSIRLKPGQTVCVRVRSGVDGREYEYGVCCKKRTTPCRTGGVGGPKIKIGC